MQNLATEISQAAANNGETFAENKWGRAPTAYPHGPGWTAERVELLKKLWAAGLSASEVAKKLGEVTRSAVIAKIHRLGLAARGTTSRIQTARPRSNIVQRMKRGSKPRHRDILKAVAQRLDAPRAKILIPVLDTTPVGRCSLADLTQTMCHWPIGDPKQAGFHYCGQRKPWDVSYCEHHAAIRSGRRAA